MKFVTEGLDFTLYLRENEPLVIQKKNHPFLYAGIGSDDISSNSGFFTVKDYVTERIPLEVKAIEENGSDYTVDFSSRIRANIHIAEDHAEIGFEQLDLSINRFWIRLAAEKEEKDFGCGEQFSYLNLRGRNFPLWTSEPGVGRDKTTYVTWMADKEGGNGGDYYTTYFPQPTFVSSRHYYFHTFCTAYADFDFRHDAFHELQFWTVPDKIFFGEADTFPELLTRLSDLLGRQMELPDFVYHGAILGLQGGTERVKELVERSLSHGIPVAGLFCQDWCGKFMDPSFGKRLRWDFRWNPDMYPGLPEQIREWEKQGIRFLGYINPNLAEGGKLYEEAKSLDVLLKDRNGNIYKLNSGTIVFGTVDLTTEKGFTWYKEVIKRELLDFGLSGWMADFGEYIPADSAPGSGEDPKLVHNHYPALWAKCNYEACKEAGKHGQIAYFMRSGAAGSQKYTALQWQGDQSVDFSRHDGLPSAIVGALSLTMSGYGLSHSDIGGFTSLYGNVRTKELFERWAEAAAFSPVMRSHEGNNPEENFQFYDDDASMEHFARMVKIHQEIIPYIRDAVRENHEKGIGVQRPLFLHYEEDEEAYGIQDEYLLGRDLLVAPICEEGASSREVYLPEDKWIHLFTGKAYDQGEREIQAPIGEPAVFYRKESSYRELFERIAHMFGSYTI
jgi:alpha-glucosidase